MKKKILTLTLCVAMLATVAISGTLAYFTDTDEEVNEFTIGNVSIDLIEDFPENNEDKILRPGDKDTNNINKDVWIKNDGTEDAYVWYEWYIPAALDSTDGKTGANNILHVNSKGATWDKYWNNANYAGYNDEKFEGTITADTTWDHDPELELKSKGMAISDGPEGFIRTETVDDITYNVYLVLYKSVVEPDKFTPQAMDQVYLDSKVDAYSTEDGNVVYTINGDNINYDFTNGVDIIVKAYGIQAEGIADVYEAYMLYNAQTQTAANND